MDLICGDTITVGTCHEVSESGLRGVFSGTVAPGTKGLLTLYAGDRSFGAHVVILSLRTAEARVRFRFQSRDETLAIREFIQLLQGPS